MRFSMLSLLLLAPLAASADEVDLAALLDAVDDATRGDASHATMTMHVKTRRYERTVTMEAWSKGEDLSLIRVLEPAKDRGVATLKSGDNLWNYLPKLDRTMKLPKTMMSGSWMGSHFSNDDLVRGSRFADDYTYDLVAQPDARGAGTWVIDCTPKPDAPIVWGRVRVSARADHVPVEVVYFDEDGTRARTLTYGDVQSVDGRPVPMVMTITPHDKPEEFTKLTFSDLSFDPSLRDDFFTLGRLERLP